MIGIVLLEAQRAGALVIGEDLGTVEPWVRAHLAERGVLGTSVLWFEKMEGDWPLYADRYRVDALSTVNTHDLPPLRATWLMSTWLCVRVWVCLTAIRKLRCVSRVKNAKRC